MQANGLHRVPPALTLRRVKQTIQNSKSSALLRNRTPATSGLQATMMKAIRVRMEQGAGVSILLIHSSQTAVFRMRKSVNT